MTTINYFWRLYTFFGCHILLSTAIHYILAAIYYFRGLYTTFDGYIPHSTAIYYFRRLCTTFSFTLLWFRKNPYLSCNSFLCGLYTRLEFNINWLALIQFSFFCNSMISPVNFNLPFWKRCSIRNTQMLKMWNFDILLLALRYCDFARIHIFPAIPSFVDYILGLNLISID